MKEKIIYEATDGKTFDAKEECELYEYKLDIAEYLENSDDLLLRNAMEIVDTLMYKYSITLKENKPK